MTSFRLYRIAALVFVLFAAGHTFGFLTFRPPTVEGRAVWDAMNNTHFTVDRETFSYGGFYIGFGLSISVYMLFSAFLAWHLGGLARRAPEAIGALGWAFCAVQLMNVPLALIYLAMVPAIFNGVAAVLLGWAALAVPPKRAG